MDGPVSHEIFNPDTLSEPKGFAHALRAAEGRLVFLGGQTGHDAAGTIEADLVAQFDRACWNVVEAMRAAGAEPEHLAWLQIFVTDVREYRARLRELGEAYRSHLGKHYPAMALLGTTELFDPRARIELVGVAVVPTL
jgi:enamine deaminase RidA (YjgF/YER057c/UK114 family)